MIERLKQLASRESYRRYFANTSWLLAEKVLRMVVSLVVAVWVTRYLGPERLGVLSYAQSLVALLAAFAGLGLNAIVVKELVEGKTAADRILGTSFVIKLAGALIALGCFALFFQITSVDDQTATMVMIIAGGYIFQSVNVIDFYFQSQVKSRYVVYASAFALFVASIAKVALILSGAPVEGFAIALTLESAILALGLVVFYRQHGRISPLRWRFDSRLACGLLRRALPLALSGMVISIYVKIDKIMLKEIMDAEAVGIYTAASALSETWFFMPTILTASLFPAIIAARSTSRAVFQRRMENLFSLLFWLALGVAIPVSVLSDQIVDVLYGGAYRESADVLQMHIWTSVFVCLGMPVSKWFVVEGLEHYALYRALLGAAANIGLNYQFIPLYGPIGAAIATLITAFLTAIVFNLGTRKLREVLVWQARSVVLPFCMVGKVNSQ